MSLCKVKRPLNGLDGRAAATDIAADCLGAALYLMQRKTPMLSGGGGARQLEVSAEATLDFAPLARLIDVVPSAKEGGQFLGGVRGAAIIGAGREGGMKKGLVLL